MQSIRLRGLRRTYKYQGVQEGYALAGWLNLHGSTPDGREVAKLLGDLQTLMSLWPNFSLEPDKAAVHKLIGQSIKSHGSRYDLMLDIMRISPGLAMRHNQPAEIERLRRAIEARLRRLFEPPTFVGFKVEGGRKRTVYHRFPRQGFLRARLIADSLENLGRLGLLHRVRQCRSCGRWLFARFDRELSCSPPCREKVFRTSPEGRQKRRDYMRRYRAGLKRMNQSRLNYNLAQRRKQSSRLER